MEADKPTVINAQGDVEGTLKGKDAQILGRFRGEIELSGRLVLGESARVQARAVADVAEIAGEFHGDLKVRSVVLLEKGRIEGTLEAQSMAVREGAQLNGSVNTGGPRSGGSIVPPPPVTPAGVLAG
jgi:cytoskeletal protein CcmA (bactofilin family)